MALANEVDATKKRLKLVGGIACLLSCLPPISDVRNPKLAAPTDEKAMV